jgi:hypothetical protein
MCVCVCRFIGFVTFTYLCLIHHLTHTHIHTHTHTQLMEHIYRMVGSYDSTWKGGEALPYHELCKPQRRLVDTLTHTHTHKYTPSPFIVPLLSILIPK